MEVASPSEKLVLTNRHVISQNTRIFPYKSVRIPNNNFDMNYTRKLCYLPQYCTNLDEIWYDRPGQYNVVEAASVDQVKVKVPHNRPEGPDGKEGGGVEV
jgi:hypothetical protein